MQFAHPQRTTIPPLRTFSANSSHKLHLSTKRLQYFLRGPPAFFGSEPHYPVVSKQIGDFARERAMTSPVAEVIVLRKSRKKEKKLTDRSIGQNQCQRLSCPRWRQGPSNLTSLPLRLCCTCGPFVLGSMTSPPSPSTRPPCHRLRAQGSARCSFDRLWVVGAVALRQVSVYGLFRHHGGEV